MPGSILINDGRRSASPDRRVTFGNIERYDIMTSNEIKNNMNKRRGDEEEKPNRNYPMTRLDNRIRKAVMLGFTPMIGDTVTYGEIIDFLVEFGVIPNQRICTERQITAIIQASFPKVITKPSAKYSVMFVNLENRSDDVVKEELVRVTTEPIIDPASREAQQWIKEVDEENYETDENEDEELTKIENHKERVSIKAIQNGKHLEESSGTSSDQDSGRETPINGVHNDGDEEEKAPIQERGIDVAFVRSPRFNENLHNNKSMSKSTGDVRSGLRRNSSFSNKNMNRSTSVVDVASKTDNSSSPEDNTDKNNARSTSTSNLQRKRSFTRSTDRSFVGSIRDRFRSSLRKKSSNDKEAGPSEHNAKALKKGEAKAAENGKNSDKKESGSSKRVTSKASFRVDSNNTSFTTNGNSNNDNTRVTVNKKSGSRYGGSSLDVRDTSICSDPTVNKNFSSSSGDIRASFRTNSSRPNTGDNRDQEVRATYRTNTAETKSSFVRSTGRNTASQGAEVRSSIRRNNNNNNTNDVRASIRKSNNEKDVTSKPATATTLIRVSNSSTTGCRNSTVRASIRDNNKKGTNIRRSNSRAGATPRGQVSANSSAQSTPTVSRENSKTNLKIHVIRGDSNNKIELVAASNMQKNASQQEKDILRIAKAFQQASHGITVSKDNIENFMIQIATDDIEPCTNNRLNIDYLYDHIRHRMIVSQHEIFEGYRSDIRLDMSQYFDLLFTALASHLNRVGCEIITDSTTQQKVCYLTHVKLIEYPDDLEKRTIEHLDNDNNDEDSDENTQASYV